MARADHLEVARPLGYWSLLLVLLLPIGLACGTSARADTVGTPIPQPTADRTMDAVVRGRITIAIPTLALAQSQPVPQGARVSQPSPTTRILPATPPTRPAPAVSPESAARANPSPASGGPPQSLASATPAPSATPSPAPVQTAQSPARSSAPATVENLSPSATAVPPTRPAPLLSIPTAILAATARTASPVGTATAR